MLDLHKTQEKMSIDKKNMFILHTCGSKPANVAYASPCGITVRPTVMPAIISLRNFSELYFGNHAKIGMRLEANLCSRSI